MPAFAYLVECSDKTLYAGWTTDPVKREKTHNSGKGAKYTRSHKPESLVYVDIFEDRASASKEEYRIKKTLNRQQKLKLIEENKEKTKDILANLPLLN